MRSSKSMVDTYGARTPHSTHARRQQQQQQLEDLFSRPTSPAPCGV
jgi:hypothetical protein